MFELEEGVTPELGKRGRPEKYPWSRMTVGDSFYVARQLGLNLHALAQIASKRLAPKHFKCARWGDGYRIWRIT
jgi:hypothetical protein